MMKYIKKFEAITNKVIMSDVNDKDAKKLIKWWNANTKYYHFKKRNGRNRYGKFDVVRQLEKIEISKEIQSGDYVIVKVKTNLYPGIDEYLNNTIGEIIHASDVVTTLDDKIQKTKEYIVMYLDVPFKFINWFNREEINTKGPNKYYKTFYQYQIEASGTIEEIQMKLAAKKYNIG